MRALLVVAMLAMLSAPAFGGSLQTANQAYLNGDFDTAIAQYEELVSQGLAHEDLFYNLGNANFRAGHLGSAIYNYERALDIAPGMADASYNVEVARSAVVDKVRDRLTGADSERWWVRVTHVMTLSELTIVVLACNAILFALLIALRFLVTGFRRTVVIVLASFFAVALVANAALLGGSIYIREGVQAGVVLPDQVVMHEGLGSATAERGQLHAGLRVQVVERRGDWVLVRLSNGVDGWVEARHIGLL